MISLISVVISPEYITVNAVYEESEDVGSVSVTDFGAVPNDGINDTEAFYTALIYIADHESTDTLIVPSGTFDVMEFYEVHSDGSRYIMCINVHSNTNIIMQDDTYINMTVDKSIDDYSGENYDLFRLDFVNNVTISGGHISGDRQTQSGHGEYGMGIGMIECSNITIKNVEISNCFGDGIYIGGNYNGTSHVVIENCHIHDNRRDNISFVNAHDVTVDNCVIETADGTAPKACLLIEPNSGQDIPYCDDICIKNCFIDNSSVMSGYSFASALRGNSILGKNVTIDSCTLKGRFYNYSTTPLSLISSVVTGKMYSKYVINGISDIAIDTEKGGISDNILEIGDTKRLYYSFAPAEAVNANSVKWSSDNKKIISVKNGVITANNPGTATVTASVGDVKDSVTLTVTDSSEKPCTDKTHRISAPKTIKMNTGKTKKLKASVSPLKNFEKDKTVDFLVSDENVISSVPFPDKKGIYYQTQLTAISPGVSYIYSTADSDGNTYRAVTRVIVKKPASKDSLTLSGNGLSSCGINIKGYNEYRLTLNKGKTCLLIPTMDPTVTDASKVSFSGGGCISSKNGVITAKKHTTTSKGIDKPARVIVSCGKAKAYVYVTVIE